MSCKEKQCSSFLEVISLKERVTLLEKENSLLLQRIAELETQNKDSVPDCVDPPLIHFDKTYINASHALLRGDACLPAVVEKSNAGDAGTEAPLGEDFPLPAYNCERTTVIRAGHSMNILCCTYVDLEEYSGLRLSGGADKLVCVFSRENTLLVHIQLEAPVISLCALPQTNYLIAGTLSGSVSFLTLKLNEEGFTIMNENQSETRNHKLNVNSIKCSSDGNWIAIASRDKTVNLYRFDKVTKAIRLSRSLNCATSPQCVDFFLNGQGKTYLVVSCLESNFLEYLLVESKDSDDAADKEKIRINMNSNGDNIVSFNVLDLATAPAGLPLLAVATDKCRHIIFQTGSAKQLRNLYGHTNNEYSRTKLAWHPTGKYLLSTSDSPDIICIWSVCSGTLKMKLQGHLSSIRDLAVHSETCELLTCSFDKTLRVWNQEEIQKHENIIGNS